MTKQDALEHAEAWAAAGRTLQSIREKTPEAHNAFVAVEALAATMATAWLEIAAKK